MNPGFYQFWTFQVFHAPQDLTIDHNTVYAGQTAMPLVFASAGGPGSNFRFTNNIIARGTYGVRGDGSMAVPAPGEGTSVLQTYMSGYAFAGNVIVRDGATTANYPSGNYWAEAVSDIGYNGYALSAGSSYAGKATDGHDPGVDVAALQKLTSAVR